MESKKISFYTLEDLKYRFFNINNYIFYTPKYLLL